MNDKSRVEKILEALELEDSGEMIYEKSVEINGAKIEVKFVNLKKGIWGFKHWKACKRPLKTPNIELKKNEDGKIEVSGKSKGFIDCANKISKAELMGISVNLFNDMDDHYMPLRIVEDSEKKDIAAWMQICKNSNLFQELQSFQDQQSLQEPQKKAIMYTNKDFVLDLHMWDVLDSGKEPNWYADAIMIVKDSLGNALDDDGFMRLFGDPPFGCNVLVVLDYDEKQKLDIRTDEHIPGASDVLGEYAVDRTKVGKITLYKQVIDEFIDELIKEHQLKDENNLKTNVYAYVLAHELFHAYQDFWVLLWGIPGNLKNKEETLAEGFALGFVRDYLKDENLFQALLRFRNAERKDDIMPLIPYDDAVKYFEENVDFYEDLKDWKAAASARWTS